MRACGTILAVLQTGLIGVLGKMKQVLRGNLGLLLKSDANMKLTINMLVRWGMWNVFYGFMAD